MLRNIMRPFWQWSEFRRARQAGGEDGASAATYGNDDYTAVLDEKGKAVIGEDGKPKLSFPQYETQVRHRFTMSIDSLIGPWAESDQTLLSRFRPMETRRKSLQQDVEVLEGEVSTLQKKHKALEERKSGFTPPVVETKAWNWVVLGIFAIFEIPLNAIAFRPFREAEIMNYALAFLIGGVLVLLAHFAGAKLKERRVGAALAMLAIPFATLCAIGYVRTIYVATGSSLSVGAAFWVFWTFGALVLAGAVVLSYMCEEGREDAVSVKRNLKEVGKALERQQAKLKDSKFSLQACTREVEALRARRKALLAKTHAEVRAFETTAKVILTEYRRQYLNAHRRHARSPDGEPPKDPSLPVWYLRMGEAGIAVVQNDPDKLDWTVPAA